MSELKKAYNKTYEVKNVYGYREWLLTNYVRSLIAIADLKQGSTILDVGCGQGFFSHLFQKYGMKVCGVDLSSTAIQSAQIDYGATGGITFEVKDILSKSNPVSKQYDCVFTRSFSLYNTDDFPSAHQVTDQLIGHVKHGGVFIFAYNTKFGLAKSASWRYHTFSDLQHHFSIYANAETYFVNKIDILLLGKFAFNVSITKLNIFMSEKSGLGGDLICIVRKQ